MRIKLEYLKKWIKGIKPNYWRKEEKEEKEEVQEPKFTQNLEELLKKANWLLEELIKRERRQ